MTRGWWLGYLALVGRGRGGDEVGVEGERPLAVGVGHLAHDLEEHAAHLLLLLGPQLLEVHGLLLLLEDVEGLLVVPRRQLEPRPAHLPRVDAHVDVDVGELLAVVEILPIDRQKVLHLGQVRQRLHRVCVCRVSCAVCRVPCAVCRVPCAVCRVPCAVCRVPCAVCRVPCAVCRVSCCVSLVHAMAEEGALDGVGM
jgi:hypothetical protein